MGKPTSGAKIIALASLVIVLNLSHGIAQTNPVIRLFPEGTVLRENVNYNNDNHHKHLLDIYMPSRTQGKVPLIILIHGGAWLSNDKYADINYMRNTVADIINCGYALASIDYRWSTEAVFPAQIQDCNRAVSFLYDHADHYNLDRNRFAVMGFSAGGHLASLLGLSKNNSIEAFFMPGTTQSFHIRAVVDFYGPSDLMLLPRAGDGTSPEARLIGAAPLERPDLAKEASPLTYIDKDDPPFLIIHGEKDDMVPVIHSRLISSWLSVTGVQNELVIIEGAPHFGEMFDSAMVRKKVISFLTDHFD